MHIRTRLLTAAVTGAVLLVPSAAAFAAHGNASVAADLKGRNEVKTDAKDNRIVGDPNGRGYATVYTGANGNELCWDVHVSKLAEVTGAHIHQAAAGANGPVVVSLGLPDENGEIEGCVTFTDANDVADITLARENYYVNVHTTEYPGGAVRGQLK